MGFATAGPGRDNDLDDHGIDLELWGALRPRHPLGQRSRATRCCRTAIGDRAAYLWVLAGNERAIRFYERQGFRLDGTQDEHDEGLHVRMLRAGTR